MLFLKVTLAFPNLRISLLWKISLQLPHLCFLTMKVQVHYSGVKTIRFPTHYLRVLLLLNISTVESLKNEIKWNQIKYNNQSYLPFLSKGLNGKVTFLSYAIIFPQITPPFSNNWSHSLVSNLLITTLTFAR